MDSSTGSFVICVAAKRGIKFFDASLKKSDGIGGDGSV